jgi:hypothetical protein
MGIGDEELGMGDKGYGGVGTWKKILTRAEKGRSVLTELLYSPSSLSLTFTQTRSLYRYALSLTDANRIFVQIRGFYNTLGQPRREHSGHAHVSFHISFKRLFPNHFQ